MTVITLPYTFVGGTRAIADQVDADFNALVNAFVPVPAALTAATTFYVAPNGADIAGNGLSPATPAATISYIFRLLRFGYNLTGQQVTIQLANGTYTESVNIAGPLTGQSAANALIIQGNMASPSLVTLSGDPGFNVHEGAMCTIQGMTLTSPTSHCILSHYHSRVIHQNNVYGAATGAHLFAARAGSIQSAGNYTISGGGWAHGYAQEGGELFIDITPTDYIGLGTGAPTVTLSGTPAYSIGFIVSNNASVCKVGAVFAGTGATGPRWHTNYNGTINIAGQGATYLPGSTAGVDNTGGVTG